MEKELIKIIKLLNRHRIKYLLIGGYAAVLYGVPRSTFDIDIGIAMNSDEISRTLALLAKQRFVEHNRLEGGVRLTNGKVNLDLMFIENYKFNFFYQYHKKLRYKGTIIKLPNMMDLIRMKESSPRERDKEDAQYLALHIN